MVLHIQLNRSENGPWGFSIIGGADLDHPFTVIKVKDESYASKCGLLVGDVITEINNIDVTIMSHQMLHELIMGFDKQFMVTVTRENEEEYTDSVTSNGSTHNQTGESNGSPCQADLDETFAAEQFDETTEEHIAEIISGESELLKEHNVMGINFQKIIPKANIFKSSEVFRHINEEAKKTFSEKDKEAKRWTTFLQKPNRPIPKERVLPRFIPNYKQAAQQTYETAPSITQTAIAQPEPDFPPTQPEPVEQAATNGETADQSAPVCNGSETNGNAEDIDDMNDDELPDLLPCANGNNDEHKEDLKFPVKTECTEGSFERTNVTMPLTKEPIVNRICETNVCEADDELSESDLEKQLAEVQKQLELLSLVPSTIRSTLEVVTKQIERIIPVIKQKAYERAETTSTQSEDELKEEQSDTNSNGQPEQNPRPDEAEQMESASVVESKETEEEKARIDMEKLQLQRKIASDLLASNTDEKIAQSKIERVFEEQQKEWMQQKKEQLVITEKVLKSSSVMKPSNGPRTPNERPLVLPGGRKWRNAQDAFNEEFIAEIISSQAELITGSTLGKYESPLLGYDDRINFLKYKKPEKDLSNLNRSEVFKLVHNMDAKPANGISDRPARVLAASDLAQ